MEFLSRFPPKWYFPPQTLNFHFLGGFNENHLKWVDFSEKCRPGREKHLKRPKMDCVFLLLRVNSGFSPPKHQKSPNFTTVHQNGGILLHLVKISEFHHSGSQSTRTDSEPCKRAYELLLFLPRARKVAFGWNLREFHNFP